MNNIFSKNISQILHGTYLYLKNNDSSEIQSELWVLQFSLLNLTASPAPIQIQNWQVWIFYSPQVILMYTQIP